MASNENQLQYAILMTCPTVYFDRNLWKIIIKFLLSGPLKHWVIFNKNPRICITMKTILMICQKSILKGKQHLEIKKTQTPEEQRRGIFEKNYGGKCLEPLLNNLMENVHFLSQSRSDYLICQFFLMISSKNDFLDIMKGYNAVKIIGILHSNDSKSFISKADID